MEQHPVPQDITAYQFRLVGDMTLKQFLLLAGGIGIAVLVYTSGLPGFFKWPLILLSTFLGVVFAFLPFEERPMDVWIKNFIRSIYSPTRYLWKKQEKLPSYFQFSPRIDKSPVPTRLTPQERARFSEYLSTLPKERQISSLDQQEQVSLNKISQFLNTGAATRQENTLPSRAPEPGSFFPSVRVRTLRPRESLAGEVNQPLAIPQATSLPVVTIAQSFTPPIEIGTPFTEPKIKPKPRPAPPPKPKLKPAVKIIKEVIMPTLPLPTPPEYPNVIIGMTVDKKGRILPGAIIEIRDSSGMPVRASKTNKLGQFFIVTPLPNGEYEIETEYPGTSFAIIKFKADGKIIPPIKIQAKENIATPPADVLVAQNRGMTVN